jgi:hypothetical protein
VTPPHHPSAGASGHPASQWASGIELRRRSPPITCISCQVTYLTPVPLPAAVPAENWICSLCLGDLVGADLQPGPGAQADGTKSAPGEPPFTGSSSR